MDEGELNNLSTLKFLEDLGICDVSKSSKPNIRRVFKVECIKCGKVFNIRASNFHKVHSCGCYVHNKETKETFITKIYKKFPEHLLNFETFNFKEGQHTILQVKCTEHGIFESTANRMLNNKMSPCPFCNYQLLNKAGAGDLNSLISKAIKKYGDKFSYETTKFKSLSEDVEIFCKEHKEFFNINANNFLYNAKVGCPSCIKDNIRNKVLAHTAEFIRRCESVHKGRYDLSKVVFEGYNNAIIVSCKEHGEWSPSAGNFRGGTGCPVCAELNGRKRYTNKPTLFYIFKIRDVYKVGISIRTLSQRYLGRELDEVDFKSIEVLFEYTFQTGRPAFRLEQHLRNKYKKNLYKGDSPFKRTGVSEIFTILPDIEYIKNWIMKEEETPSA